LHPSDEAGKKKGRQWNLAEVTCSGPAAVCASREEAGT
jgi:hypothetical protein